MRSFAGRVAVVTGGASGIGLALARAFADRGAHLVLADIDEAGAAAAAREIAARGVRALPVATDVRERGSVADLARAAFREFGRVHLVCNNAGVAPLGALVDAKPEDWQTAMAINFWGVVHGIDAFLAHLLENEDGGHVVNTASMAGLVGMHGLGVYCATKFAVVGLTESLHRELQGTKVGVSLLCPMIVATRIGENSRRFLAGATAGPGEDAPPAAPPVQGGVISAEEVARRVLRGIERGDLYVFTHPEQRDILRRRAARQDSMFADDVFPL
jgi:NAD(P)-dependent dehydrogenase (short-subunit alcohol dehydrogenase family)